MTMLPEPLTPAARRQLQRLFSDAAREAARVERMNQAYLRSLYRDGVRGKRS